MVKSGMQGTHKYDDIICMPHPISARHARMSPTDRGAQFAPFAALVGFEAVLEESARQTEVERCLDEHGKELLDRKLHRIAEQPTQEEITFLCFRQDARKSGGSHLYITGKVKKIDLCRRSIFFEDGLELEIDSIRAIEGMEDYFE